MLTLPEHQALQSIDGEFTSGAINVAGDANLPEHQALWSINGEFTPGAINVAGYANPSRAPGITVNRWRVHIRCH